MNFDNWNPELIPVLQARAAEFAKLGADELAKRIVVALMVQDSCKECWIETMEQTLITGRPALFTCVVCTKELTETWHDCRATKNTSAD